MLSVILQLRNVTALKITEMLDKDTVTPVNMTLDINNVVPNSIPSPTKYKEHLYSMLSTPVNLITLPVGAILIT